MWHLDPQQRTAALNNDVLTARVFVDQPDLGIGGLKLKQQHLSTANLLRVGLSSTERTPVLDCYVRGQDVVITYGDSPYRKNVRPQVYWRLVDQQVVEARGIELVLSIETDLLSSDPHAHVESTLTGHEALALTDVGWEPIGGTGQVQLQPPYARPIIVIRGDGWSYAEMIYPGDFTFCSLKNSDGNWRIRWDLFQEHLEKGVIRRARLRSVFLTADDDLRAALAAFERFQNAPLPLTT